MKEEKILTGGAIVAAIAASLCCIGPLLFAVLGLGAFGAASVFETGRPYFLAFAVLVLAFGFYRSYFRKESCAPGDACATQPVSRVNRVFLWVASAAVLAFALSPYYAGTLATRVNRQSEQTAATEKEVSLAASQVQSAVAAHVTNEATITLKIKGMTCASCEATIQFVLERTPGVRSAAVSFDRSEAVVKYDPSKATPERLAQAVNENTDYVATLP
jgi:mercuric ion transport protein